MRSPLQWPIHRLVLCVSLAALAGCDRAVVSGRVVTVENEALPGVVVSVEDVPGLEALTNTRGKYTLITPKGLHALRYAKSGYAPAVSSVEALPQSTVELDDVAMWRLPPGKGVYLYEGGRYDAATLGEPRPFLLDGETVDFAIRVAIETRTENLDPLIVCYHMPRYEARLTRLRTATAQLKEGQDYTFDVWARGGSIPVRLVPVDEPEGLLMKVVVDEPVEEGAYALHWGAMVGDTVLEPRAYLFEIVPPPASGDAAESEPENDGAADGAEAPDESEIE